MAGRRADYWLRLRTDNPGNSERPFAKVGRRGGADKRYHLDGLLKEEKGWVIIEMLVSLFVLSFLLFAAVEYWGVFTIYQHTESLKYHALSKMEVAGGLYPLDEQDLVEKLIDLGADPATIKIEGDVKEEGEAPVLWPKEVSLRIEFVPEYFDNFMARTLIGGNPGDPVRIGVKGSVVSQKT